MISTSIKQFIFIALLGICLSFTGMGVSFSAYGSSEPASEPEVPKGIHNGRLLTEGDFSLELTIFERGVPPEFRLYAQYQGKPVSPEQVQVSVQLLRLGGVTDNIEFAAEADYLRGNMTVYEPHSFQVRVSARYGSRQYQWQYDNFEGRTQISAVMAEKMAIKTEIATQQRLQETLTVYGTLTLPPKSSRTIRARYAGLVKKLYVAYGDSVKKGQRLMSIESDESLQTYHVLSPIDGVISEQLIAEGEQTAMDDLLVVTDFTKLMAELTVFPSQQEKVMIGAEVKLTIAGSAKPLQGKILDKRFETGEAHTQRFRVVIDNADQQFTIGQFVTAEITVATHQANVAVRADAIQSFRDFQVVYAKFGDEYEVRMLTLGRRTSEWVEVLSGLPAGTEYVSVNSYVIKADIEKSGAAHDH